MGHMGKWVSWLKLKTEIGHLGGGVTLGDEAHGQRGIMVNTEDRDGIPWGMGHMGDGVHGQHVVMCNFLNTAWIFTKVLLQIDIDVFYLNIV